MSKGNNLFTLGLDVASSKALMSAQIKSILKEIEAGSKIKVKADLDTSNLKKNLNNVKVDVKTNGASQASNEIANISNSAKVASNSVNNLQKSMSGAWTEGVKAAAAYKAFQLLASTAKSAVSAVTDIDSAITSLRMATNGSYEDVARLVDTYNQLGQSMGATTTEVSGSADAWLRQGHSIQETNTLIKDSMMLSKIANLDSAQSTEYLTSAMKGYKLAAEDVSGVVDKLTSVDLVSATDAGGLAEAMSRVAVTADTAGVSMDQLLGYLATVGEVTQKSMSSIGESFKTIFTRMSDIKSQKLELVDEDGTTEALSDVEATLQSVGIDLRSTVNEYNSYGEVLDNLALKWDSLSQVQQNALAKAFAGTRQAENFRVLMENYDSARQYMEVAADSAGTAEQKFEAYEESIEAKVKSLQASFESLATSTLDSSLVGGVVEAADAFLDFADKTNLVKGSLAGISVAGTVKMFTSLGSAIKQGALHMVDFSNAMSILQKGNIGTSELTTLGQVTQNLSKSQMTAVLSSKALTTEQRVAILSANGMGEAEAMAQLQTMGLVTAEGTATVATFSLSGALKGLWATLMANPLILVVAGITAAVSVFSSLKQKAEETRQAALDAGNAAKESSSNIMELYNAYSSATQSKEGLTDATDALLGALGVEKGEIEGLVEQYGNLDNAIQNLTIDSLKDKLGDLTAGYEASIDELKEETKNGFFGDFSAIDFKKQNGAYQVDEYVKALEKAGIKVSDDFSYNGGYRGSSIDIGDTSTLEGIMDAYAKLKEMRQALEDGIGDAYTREELAQNDIYSGINDKINSFEKEYDGVLEYIEKVNDVAAQIQLMSALSEGVPQTTAEFDAFKTKMQETANESGNFVGSQEDINNAINNTMGTLPELSQFFDSTGMTAEDAANSIESAAEQATASIVTMSATVNNLVDGIKGAQDVLDGQSTGKSIFLADFNAEGMEDYRSALVYVNGSLQLNRDKVNEIIQAKGEEQIAVNDTNKAYAQSQYLANAAEIEKLRAKLRDNTFAADENAESVQKSISSYLAENDALLDTINTYDLMNASITEATSAYQNWLNAQNAAQSGDMFDSSLQAMQKISDTLNNSESDDYGRIGNEDYKAAVKFIIPESVNSEDQAAVNSYMDSIADMFTYDDDGGRKGLNIENFCQKSIDEGLMTLDEASGQYKIAGQKTMQDFADGLGLSLPMVQAMFGEMEEFGGEFSWADEGIKSMGDLGVAATESANKLREIDQFKDLSITMDVSDIEANADKLSQLDATIAEMNGVKAKVDVDSSEAEYANQVIQYCVAQKQLLSQPAVMTVDTSLVQGELGNAIALMQEFQTAKDNLEMTESLGLDTSDAQAQLDTVTAKIQGLDTNVSTTLNIDTSSVDTISATIAALSPKMMVKAGIDDTAIIGFQNEEHNADGKVTWNNDSSAVDAYAAARKSASGQVHWYNDTSLVKTSFTATGTINWSGGHSLNGTAHAGGTAKAGGDWGTANGGTTLVGELGQEIVVDPRTGRWYTVGDNGAEFANIPKGAIVFNHKQSESLLNYGFVDGRGSALAWGTAMVTGGISVSQAQKPTGGGSTSNSTPQKTYTSTTSSASTNSSYTAPVSSKETNNKSDDFEKTFDFVEIALDRISKAVDRLKKKAESVYKSFTNRNTNLADEMTMITSQINLQNQAYNKYMQKANSVGLSASWQEKVKNGSIDISTITDEDLADKISDFKDYYEKAIDAKDAVADLHEELAKLYNDKFDNISSQYDGELSLLEHLTTTYKNGLDLLEAEGMKGSTKFYKCMQEIEKQNVEIMNNELNDLMAAYNSAIASGEIEKGSQAWYDMNNAINAVRENIQESKINLAQFAKELRELDWSYFDYMQERISSITDEADFLIDLMSNGDLFDDKGNITDTGTATMGLHGQNYNTYMNQADQYAQEILKLNKEIAKDPYNTDLIERREELLGLQRDSIKSAEDEKQAIIDLVQDGIDAQISSMKDLIDAYTESLDSAKDLYDYQKKVKQQTAEIASLQKQLSAYQNDTSEENRSKIQKIEVDLSKAMEDLQETEYQQYITDQKKLLDELQTEYETLLNERLDDVDALISETIDTINASSGAISDTLIEQAGSVGYTLTESMKAIWSNDGGANSIITKYGDGFTSQLTAINTAINGIKIYTDGLQAKADAEAAAKKAAEEAAKKKQEEAEAAKQPTPTTPTTPSKPQGTKFNEDVKRGIAAAIWVYGGSKSGWGNDPQRKQRLTAKFGASNAAAVQSYINAHANNGDLYNYWVSTGKSNLSKYYYNAFKDGSEYIDKDQTAWTNEIGTEGIIRPSQSAILTPLAKGDSVLTSEATKNLWDMANDPAGFINGNLFTNGVVSGSANSGDQFISSIDSVEFVLPNVTNYQELMNQAIKDPKFEKLIQAMTIDRAVGRSRLAKNKYYKA